MVNTGNIISEQIKNQAQNGIYDANFFEALSGSAGFIKPDSIVSAMIFEAKETLFIAMLNRLRTD